MTRNSPHRTRNNAVGTRPARSAFALCALLAAAVPIGGCSSKTSDDAGPASASTTAHDVSMTAQQRQHIRLYTVAQSTFHRTIETTGAVDFDNDRATSVIAPFSGPVTRLLVSPGDRVGKGQALAMVDSPDFAAAVSTYAKALATAKTDRRLADADRDLGQHEGVAQRENEQAQTDAANAESDRDAARQALLGLGVDPAAIKAVQQGRTLSPIEGVIRSPIAGTVAERLITPGLLLQAGSTACFTVADLSRVWVMAQVSSADLGAFEVGDPAQIVTGIDDRNFAGSVDNIAALVNPDTRSVIARVVVDNPGDFLKKQMYVTVRIRSRQARSGLLVPVSAILRDDENLPFVYVAQADGSFARRPVTLGERTGDRFDIPDGLHAGDRVVVDGGIFVQFMQNQ